MSGLTLRIDDDDDPKQLDSRQIVDVEGMELEENLESKPDLNKDELDDEWEHGPWWKRNKQRLVFLLFGLAACIAMCVFAGYTYTHDPEHSGGSEGGGRADRLLTSETLVDMQNGLAWRVRAEYPDVNLWSNLRDSSSLATDFVRIKAGGVKGQFWSAWVPCHPVQMATQMLLEQIDVVHRLTQVYKNETRLCRTAADAAATWEDQLVASFISVQGMHAVNGSVALLHQLKAMGVVSMALTHDCSVSWAESWINDGAEGEQRQAPYASRVGLDEFGVDMIHEMNRVGIVVDLSGSSAATMRDVLHSAGAPVIFSHSNPRALANSPRNIPDDVLELVKLNKGTVFISFNCDQLTNEGAALVAELELKYGAPFNATARVDAVAEYRSRAAAANCTAERVVEHIMYVVGKIGIEHVGLGSDFDNLNGFTPIGLEDVSTYHHLAQLLLERGLDENEVTKIISSNVVRVLEAVEDKADLLEEQMPQTRLVSPDDGKRVEITERDCVGDLCEPIKLHPGRHGAVAADSKTCSDVGAELLRRGGHAVDAAIGTALCLGVVHPMSSGIGGGGFMTIYDAATKKSHAINFREVAPLAANATMFVNRTDEARRGPLAAGVPGELRGLQLAHALLGELPWADIVSPAAALAERGFFVDKMLAQALQNVKDTLPNARYATFWSLYAPGGKIAKEGDKIVNAALAQTLRLVAKRGAEDFYQGALGDSLASDVRAMGGIITEQDLSSYAAERLDVQSTRFRGAEVLSAKLPSAGGPMLGAMLNIYDGFAASSDAKDAVALHRRVEAMKFAFGDRSQLGDPSFFNVDGVYPDMIGDEHARQCRNRINDSRTFEPYYYNLLYALPQDSGTSHLSVIDQQGSAVALTTTVNLLFGSMMVSPSTGVLLNDQMDDFSVDPNESNAFGLAPSRANQVQARKHPLSSMSPTIVLSPDTGLPWIVIGASGGPTIPTSVFQVLVSLIDHKVPIEQVLDVPRLHHQLLPNRIMTEPGYPEAAVLALRARNHTVDTQTGVLGDGQRMGVVQVAIRQADGTLRARSDPRKGGLADAFRK